MFENLKVLKIKKEDVEKESEQKLSWKYFLGREDEQGLTIIIGSERKINLSVGMYLDLKFVKSQKELKDFTEFEENV